MKQTFKSLFRFCATIVVLPVVAQDGEFEALFLNVESRKSVDSDYVAAVDERLEIERIILKDNQSYHLYFIRGEFQVSSVYRKEGKVYEQFCLVIEREGIELVRVWVEGISVQRISEHQNPSSLKRGHVVMFVIAHFYRLSQPRNTFTPLRMKLRRTRQVQLPIGHFHPEPHFKPTSIKSL